jgi:hypothetical protein
MVRLRSAGRSAFAGLLLAAACAPDAPPSADAAAGTPATADSAAAAPAIADVATPADSTSRLAVAELLAAFRTGVDSVGTLADAPDDRRTLAEAYVQALATRDTTGIVRHLVSRAEYAWLFFPDSPFARPPYEAPPEIVWMMLRDASERGVQKALATYGGHPATFHALNCDPQRRYTRGRVTLWQYCRVELTGGEPATRRELELFGGILEIDGRVKFLSLGNEL